MSSPTHDCGSRERMCTGCHNDSIARLRAELDIYKRGGELLGQDRKNAIAKMNEAEAKARELQLQVDELTKKGEALCQQAGWALVVLNRLLSLHELDVAKDGDHPEFCDCAWCRSWGDVREVTGRSQKRKCPRCEKSLDSEGHAEECKPCPACGKVGGGNCSNCF